MKMFRRLFLCLIFLLSTFFYNDLFAQVTHSCGFDHIHKKNMQDPNYRQLLEEHNALIQYVINSPKPKLGTIYKIPVVVHVLHLGEAVGSGSNISDAQIQSAISNLNDVYRKVLTSQVSSQSVDIEVEFELAKRDPNCNNTNGIVRVNASSIAGYTQYGVLMDGTLGADENTLKDLSKWPTDQYMNFWIVSEIDNNNGGSGIQGYANLPVGIDAYNGAVMMAGVFGYDPTGTLGYVFGPTGGDNSTVIHEVGHFLDLYHPFETNNPATSGTPGVCSPSENSTNCSTVGDFVCDTPPTLNYLGFQSNTVYYNCPNGTANTCGSGNLDQVLHNFMNYTSCPDRFTAGQKDRITAALQTTRNSLTTSLGLTPPTGTFTAPIAGCASITTGQGLTGGFAGITDVQFSNLHKVSSSTDNDNPTNGYMDFSNSCLNVANLQVGQTYPLKVSTWFNTQKVKAWIDFNNNGVFTDSGEEVTPSGGLTSTSGAQVTQNVVIPASAVLNTYLRMRVKSEYNSSTFTSCSTITYGQAEDYAVYITNNTSTLDCDFTASSISICANLPITFTSSIITGTPTSWNWIITPSTGITYTGSTSASSQNPQIIFANAGTYTVKMIAADGVNSDTTLKTSYITINSLPTIAETITNPTCGTNGSIIYNASNGLVPYTLTFNSVVQPSLTVSNLAAGSYNYSITDGNTCTAVGVSSLSSAGGPNVTIAGTNATCGLSNGTGTVSISGNTGVPIITWSSGGTSLVENNLAAGNYTATVVVDGCTFNLNLTINAGSGPQLTVSSTNASCGNTSGTATAIITGNSGTPVYSWSNGGSTATISNLPPATYTINVTVDGCTLTNQITISSLNPTLNVTNTQPTCGLSNGSATVVVSGNTGIPTFVWNNTLTTATISSIGSGTYSVTVSVDGCTLNGSTTLSPSGTANVVLTTTQPTCGLSNGSIVSTVTGNTGTPSYVWNHGATTSSISNLGAGIYSVTITVDGCTLSGSSTLSSTSPILAVTPIQPSCGLLNGTVTASVTGNTGTPTYSWNNGGTTPLLTNLGAGTYSVTALVDGCTLTGNATLLASQLAISLVTTDPVCGGADGSISASVSGNTGVATYAWSNGLTTNTISNLIPGNYSVMITVDGCSFNQDTVLLNTASNAGILRSNQWVCLNSDYTLNLNGFHGTILNWYESTDNVNYISLANTDSTYVYHVTSTNTSFYVVTQNGSCPPDTSNIVRINTFTQPSIDSPLLIEVISGQPADISATATNGTYNWSPANYFSNESSLSTTVTVPTSQYVYVTIVDDNGCTNTDSTILFVVDSLIHDLKFPTAFSPNGDGINEHFEFFNTIGLEDLNFVLFDRWGEIIYKTSNPADKWNGTYKGEKVITGIYTYDVTYKYINGKTGHQAGYVEIIN
jgi:gliding motility-associated-like protein